MNSTDELVTEKLLDCLECRYNWWRILDWSDEPECPSCGSGLLITNGSREVAPNAAR